MAPKYLIIVESPNKVRHIQEFVGPNYKVMASVGHVTKINDSGKYKIGVDYDNNFATDWVVDPDKKEVVANLKKAVKDAEMVFLASDFDNEGESIAAHLEQVLKIPKKKLRRVVFKEITKSSVLEGLQHPMDIDYPKAYSAMARAKLDKIVGYRLSPIVLSKQGGKSAGRVQSVALKLVVEKEKEIQAFKSKEYYEIYLPFLKDGKLYKAQYKGTDAKKLTSVPTEKEAKEIVEECNGKQYLVDSITEANRKVKTKPPFITSTLQQECSSRLGYSPKNTMSHAQKLFENGLITYMRTDSTRLSDEFISAAKDLILSKFGKEYYSGTKTSKKKDSNVQDAHEAIRCTDLLNTPQHLRETGELSGPELRVYTLIYNRCVASLMSDAEIIDTTVTIKNGNHNFAIVGHTTKFPGFKAMYKEDDDDEEQLPLFKVKEKINDKELEIVKKKTNPPSRYSEASLVKKLEDLKIGRPSTYASMVSVVTDSKRGYTTVEGKAIKPTEKGIRVSEFLDKYFDKIINYQYTANLEENLEKVANGEIGDVELLTNFYNELKPLLTEANKADSGRPAPVKTDKVCPKCGKPLVIRSGQFGQFYACSGFPKCRYTEKIIEQQNDEDVVHCPTCHTGILVERHKSKGKGKGELFYGCSKYPDCKTAVSKEKYEELKRQKDAEDYSDTE